MTSTTEKPLCRMAFFSREHSSFTWYVVLRATKGRSRAFRQLHRVKVPVDVPVRGRGRQRARPGHRRILPTRHAVDAVVHQNRGQVDIAARRVDEVVSADGSGVAVAHGHHHVQIRGAPA